MQQHLRWIVTVDGRKATLFSCKMTPGGTLHLDRVRSLDNPHEGEHERHRPSLLGGAERRGGRGGSSATAAPHTASFGHELEEEQRRFAREVTGWLSAAGRERGKERISVFAAPRVLGLLREQTDDLGPNVDLREGDLTHLAEHELAEHQAVRNAVTGPAQL